MAGQEDDGGQEKSFDPTPRRLQQARERGDIAVSQDLHVAAGYFALLAGLAAAGAGAAKDMGAALAAMIGHVDQLEGRIAAPGGLMLSAALVGAALVPALLLFAAPAVGALASLFAQQGFTFATEKIEPKLSRISPIATAQQKFGPTGLFEFAKSAIKMTLIGVAATWWVIDETPRLIGLARAPARMLGPALGETLISLLLVIAMIAAAIGAVDWIWQRFDHMRKLRMSLQEIRDESKETEGDPHTKSARRKRGEEIATNRMLLDVPKADVVIVNPTHFAVALQWTRGKGTAPKVVAKGVDDVAARIRAKAAEFGVPIHRDPPTARALHATVEIGREIKPDHYRAVAAAIRFADQMRAKARGKPTGGRP